MFSSSTQRNFWTFSSQTELDQLRQEANHKFVSERYDGDMDAEDPIRDQYFLSPYEESVVRRHYETELLRFCRQFSPPMPLYVSAVAVAYYKRFYLHNSIMDYHPKDIFYPCVYLACKVEEFNVTVAQFVENMELFSREEAGDLVLSQELLLMQMLHYHLTVHLPYRPVEGLLIDIKTRSDIADPERLHPAVDSFNESSLATDCCLLFSPSQIALASLIAAGNTVGVSLDSYVANKLLESGGREQLMKLVESIRAIRQIVKNVVSVNGEEFVQLEDKLERCRNQENNPLSEQFRHRIEEMLEEDENRRAEKRLKLDTEVAMEEDPLDIQCLD